LKRHYGYTENEAEAVYYLWKAWWRFTKMYKYEAEESAEESGVMPGFEAQMFLMGNVHPHFQALDSLLARRVLGRHYREGLGSRSTCTEERQPE
jgi:hypothetical protein